MDIMKHLRDKVSCEEQRIALNNCIGLFITGSQLYGTNTAESDTDYEGIFIEPPEYILGSKSCDEVSFSTNDSSSRNTSEDIDCKLYSLRKYLSLAQQNNPNKIEWFFIPENKFVFKDDKFWNKIMDNKNLFLSLKLKYSFSGYAKSQESKLITKKKRFEELKSFRKVLLQGLCEGCETIGDLDLIDTKEHKKYHHETDTVGTHLVKKMKDNYQYIEYKKTIEGTDSIRVDNKDYNLGMSVKRIYDYVDKEASKYGGRITYIKEYGFDLKFASHLFRLYFEGFRLLEQGDLVFPMPAEEVLFMKEIKAGKYSLDFLLKKSKELEPQFDKAYIDNKANLPYSPNQVAINKLQQDIILEFWKDRKYL